MTVEVTPVGVRCNLACTYCYQDPMRLGGAFAPKWDMDKMLAALEAEGQPFTVFGGEALLMPLPGLERLWEYGLRRYKQNGVQTNGSLITPAHIEAFLKYRVYVGFSIDGPGELNEARKAPGPPGSTALATAASCSALAECLRRGVPTSLIVTLTKRNGTHEGLAKLTAWLAELEDLGLKDARVHALEVDTPVGREEALSQADQLVAMRHLRNWSLEPGRRLRFDIFTDILNLLKGTDMEVACTWNGCDPHTTPAVRAVDSNGERSNCGRTNKDGVNWIKANKPGQERQIILYNTPQADGGCQGCRFFFACKGQCPGEAIDGDFRNRSENCPTWFGLFEDAERDILRAGGASISTHAILPAVEKVMLEAWAAGRAPRVAQALLMVGSGSGGTTVAQEGHNDSPHGDSHGDHTDAGRA